MYIILWVLGLVVWFLSLLILIIALTNIWPNNVFAGYQLIIGILFFNTTALLKLTYSKFYKNRKQAISIAQD